MIKTPKSSGSNSLSDRRKTNLPRLTFARIKRIAIPEINQIAGIRQGKRRQEHAAYVGSGTLLSDGRKGNQSSFLLWLSMFQTLAFGFLDRTLCGFNDVRRVEVNVKTGAGFFLFPVAALVAGLIRLIQWFRKPPEKPPPCKSTIYVNVEPEDTACGYPARNNNVTPQLFLS